MTIEEEIAEDPSPVILPTAEEMKAEQTQTMSPGIGFGSALDDIQSSMNSRATEEPPPLLVELLDLPDFLKPRQNGTILSVLATYCERSIVKIQYWLDVYQLLTMRQLIRVASYTGSDRKQVKYTCRCASERCLGSFTMTRRTALHHPTIREEIAQDEAIAPLVHTCRPHCQWGTTGYSSEFKAQGFVMTLALSFAIVASFSMSKTTMTTKNYRPLSPTLSLPTSRRLFPIMIKSHHSTHLRYSRFEQS